MFKQVAEKGPQNGLFDKAYNFYQQGDIEGAILMYVRLAEIGYEVAQSNAAYLLEKWGTHL